MLRQPPGEHARTWWGRPCPKSVRRLLAFRECRSPGPRQSSSGCQSHLKCQTILPAFALSLPRLRPHPSEVSSWTASWPPFTPFLSSRTSPGGTSVINHRMEVIRASLRFSTIITASTSGPFARTPGKAADGSTQSAGERSLA